MERCTQGNFITTHNENGKLQYKQLTQDQMKEMGLGVFEKWNALAQCAVVAGRTQETSGLIMGAQSLGAERRGDSISTGKAKSWGKMKIKRQNGRSRAAVFCVCVSCPAD